MDASQAHADGAQPKYAHNATTAPQKVSTVAELRMALEDKARGQRIAQLRKRKRLTQQAMAERLKIAYRTYQTWEAGTLPEWDNLEKLARFHRVKPEHIIGDVEEPAPERGSQLDRIERKVDLVLSALDGAQALPGPPSGLVRPPREREPTQRQHQTPDKTRAAGRKPSAG